MSQTSQVHVGSIVVRCARFDELVEFWQAALGYVPREPPRDGWVVLTDPTGAGPNVSLDRVWAPVQVPPKLHLDLYAEDQAAEVARLKALGATEVHWDKRPVDADYIILADPEGNRFCVIDLAR